MSRPYTQRTSAQMLGLGTLAVLASFGLGIGASDQLQTIQHSAATDGTVGDLTADGIVDERDIIAILEVAQGYRPATIAELQADPNGDASLTVDDALRVLRFISHR